MRGDPRARAVAALGHRQFNKLRALIPPEDHDDARKLLSWFITAASFDPKGADTPAYREAHAALHGLVAAQDLGNRAARLYHCLLYTSPSPRD